MNMKKNSFELNEVKKTGKKDTMSEDTVYLLDILIRYGYITLCAIILLCFGAYICIRGSNTLKVLETQQRTAVVETSDTADPAMFLWSFPFPANL